jgi:hypothetical protein
MLASPPPRSTSSYAVAGQEQTFVFATQTGVWREGLTACANLAVERA